MVDLADLSEVPAGEPAAVPAPPHELVDGLGLTRPVGVLDHSFAAGVVGDLRSVGGPDRGGVSRRGSRTSRKTLTGFDHDPNLIDMAPTILAALDAPARIKHTGRVLHEVVGSAEVTQRETPAPAVAIPGMPSGDSSTVSDTEADQMEERLGVSATWSSRSWLRSPEVHRGAVEEPHGPSIAETRSHRSQILRKASCMISSTSCRLPVMTDSAPNSRARSASKKSSTELAASRVTSDPSELGVGTARTWDAIVLHEPPAGREGLRARGNEPYGAMRMADAVNRRRRRRAVGPSGRRATETMHVSL